MEVLGGELRDVPEERRRSDRDFADAGEEFVVGPFVGDVVDADRGDLASEAGEPRSQDDAGLGAAGAGGKSEVVDAACARRSCSTSSTIATM